MDRDIIVCMNMYVFLYHKFDKIELVHIEVYAYNGSHIYDKGFIY